MDIQEEIQEQIEEIKNPYTDEFKAKWWDRYHDSGCTLDHIQRLYNLNRITKEDFTIITGEEPQEHNPVKQEPTLEDKVNALENELLKAEQSMMDMEIELLLLK